MIEGTNIDYIAWWGAGLSTLLALVKIWELWQSRFRIDIGYGFTGHAEHGNDIYIRNLSDKPIILSYWELFYRSNKWPFKKDTYIISPEADAYDMKIEPHSSKTLNFNGIEHFSWGAKAMKGRRIYMRITIVGRATIVRRVYGW